LLIDEVLSGVFRGFCLLKN